MSFLTMLDTKSLNKVFILAAAALMLGAPQAGCAANSAQTQAAPPMQARFEQIDVDKDGKIVLEEFRAAFPNMNEKAFMVIDRNGDNGIEQAEWYEFVENHGKPAAMPRRQGAPMNNMPGDPLIPPPDSSDLPLVRPPMN